MPAVAQNLPDERSVKVDYGADLIVCQCVGCGLVQLDPDVKPVTYFKEVIRAVAFSSEMRAFRVHQFKEFVKQHSLTNKKIIEIGCGKGEYLEVMRESGAKVYGLEYGKEAVKNAQELGLDVIRGFIDSVEYKIENGPFDGFFMLNFLEHLPDPRIILTGIYNNLTDGAIGIVEVPNFDMIVRTNLFSEFMRDHLFYFTKESLTTTLQINGFEVLSCKEIWKDYSLSAVVKKRAGTNLVGFATSKDKIQNELTNFIVKHKDVAIWGAGHQAFAVMSMMELGDRIKYVIDSALFKQGKFTPATHIPIVDPENLRSNPVSAVIVIAGSYSDEVSKILRDKYDRNISIAIVRDFGLEIF